MAEFSFVHVTTEATAKQAVSRHNAGLTRPDTALTRASWDHQPTVCILDNRAKARDARAGLAKVKKTRGRPGVSNVRFLFGHPPAFEADNAWPRSKVEAWSRDTAAWLSEWARMGSGGKAVVERVDLHVDEARPHLHASLVPAVGDLGLPGPGRRMSWRQILLHATGEDCRQKPSCRRAMAMLQTQYSMGVGEKYGMVRGEVGSTAVRAEPDGVLGLKKRAELAERRVQELERANARTRRGVEAERHGLEAARVRQRVRARQVPVAERGPDRSKGRVR